MAEFTTALYDDAVRVARTTARRSRHLLDADEAESVACVLIAKAVRNYRADLSTSLRDHVRCRVRHGIREAIRTERRRSRLLTRHPASLLLTVPVRKTAETEVCPDLCRRAVLAAGRLGRKAIEAAVRLVEAGNIPTQGDVVQALRAQGMSWRTISRAMTEARKAVEGGGHE